MDSLFLIAPVAIAVIGYMIVRSQGQSPKPPKPSSSDQGWNDGLIFASNDNNEHNAQVETHTKRHSSSESDDNSAPSNCNDIAASDSTSSSNSSWDSGSSSCSIDSSPSVDTSSY